ncbi:hypothetical protein MRX96_043221 [Rhipicephalus microplus]
MASRWAKEAQSLHGLHVLRSAHFLSLLAEAVGVSWCHTTALFDLQLESLQRRDTTTNSGTTDVRVGMLLMDYRAQAAATRMLVADVFLTLSKDRKQVFDLKMLKGIRRLSVITGTSNDAL